MGSSKPTIIIAPGAWHSPEHFQPLVDNLTSHGYKAAAVLLPTMHWESLNLPPPTGNSEDVKAIKAAVLSELTTNPTTDVILVTHSYAGIPGSAAIESLDKNSRLAQGHSNGIAALLVISGLLIPAGTSSFDLSGNQVPPALKVSTVKSPVDGSEFQISSSNPDPGPVYNLYHDLPPAEAEYYASILKPQTLAAHQEPIPFAGHLVVPVYYLVCEEDRALPPQWQRLLIDNSNKAIAEARAKSDTGVREGVEINVHSIQSGHSPFLSRVEETAQWVRRSAGEKI